jgi:hypothetical protein
MRKIPFILPIKTVANINMDGLNRFSKKQETFTIVGQGQSELEDYLKEEVDKR